MTKLNLCLSIPYRIVSNDDTVQQYLIFYWSFASCQALGEALHLNYITLGNEIISLILLRNWGLKWLNTCLKSHSPCWGLSWININNPKWRQRNEKQQKHPLNPLPHFGLWEMSSKIFEYSIGIFSPSEIFSRIMGL